MIILTIGNSYSQITGLTSEPFNKLRKLLSYEANAQATYFSGGFANLKYLIDKKGEFASGLLHTVEDFLLANNLKYDFKNMRKRPKTASVELKYNFKHKPYPAQLKATAVALRAHRGIISMPTGSGKSTVIAMIIANLNVKTLIVVPNLAIKQQLQEGLYEIFGHTKSITVENIDSASLMFDKDFDCLIIDEAHHNAAKTYQTLNKLKWNGIYYRFFLTATPFRNQDNEQLLFQALSGELIYKLSYEEAVKEKYIVPVEAYYIELQKQKVEGYTWAEVYSELVVNNQARNTKIVELCTNLDTSGMSTLCLVKEIKHGKMLSEESGFPFTNGQDEESRSFIKAFNEGKIKTLIATEGVFSEGVDSKACEYVIIAALGKAKSAFMQKVGRCVRTYPGKESGKVILFKDISHKFTIKHFNEQKKILKQEYGVLPTKLET